MSVRDLKDVRDRLKLEEDGCEGGNI